MTCLSAYMYRHISKCTDKSPKRHYYRGVLITFRGGGAIAPLHFYIPPPPLATLMIMVVPLTECLCLERSICEN